MVGLSSIAQPTITGPGVNFIIGETLITYNGAYVSPGSSGTNQTWDLTSISSTSTLSCNFVAPSSTSYGGSFPNANIAAATTNSSNIGYYLLNSSVMQNNGSRGNNITLAYSDPEDLLRYPMTYNKTFSDTWSTQFVNQSYLYYREGTTTVTADGYGTLITPEGTFQDVLRVHILQSYQDSTYLDYDPFIITYTNSQYLWYKEGIHFQLASIYTLTSSFGQTYSGASWSDNNVGIENYSNLITSCSLYPNPVSNNLNIDLSLVKNQDLEINIINSIGQTINKSGLIKGNIGDNSINLNLENLPEGIYLALISSEGKNILTQRIIISR